MNLDDRDQWLADAATENGFAGPYLLGDADLDGSVKASDLNSLGSNWLTVVSKWSQGDFTANGFVDSQDLNAIGLNWQGSTLTAAAVPEPSAFGLWLGALLLIGCRRRLKSV